MQQTTARHGRVTQGRVWFTTDPETLKARAESARELAKARGNRPQVVIRRRPDGTRERITSARGNPN